MCEECANVVITAWMMLQFDDFVTWEACPFTQAAFARLEQQLTVALQFHSTEEI